LKNDEKAKTGSRVADQVMPTGKAAARSPVIFAGRKLLATIHYRSALVGGKSYSGPAIVNEYGATTVIPPDVRFHVDRAGNLVILTKVRPSNRKK
jgi:N-methylhydantoinase A/oxoprolinase/acetone carboxylase beta subunit